MKYIIKKCNCLILGACCAPNANRLYCKDITDCTLKRIVEICRNDNCNILNNNECFMYKNDAECCNLLFRRKMLELLEIEKVDE